MNEETAALALREAVALGARMSFDLKALPAWLVVVTAVSGCAPSGVCRRFEQPATYVEYGLPLVERGSIAAEVDAALLADDDAGVALRREYRALSADECQCFAVEASAVGKLLDRQRSTCNTSGHFEKHHRAECVRLGVLQHLAAEARNKNAADALKLYYGLAEVEAGLDATAEALNEIDDVQQGVGQLRDQELTVPFDASQFDRQRQTLLAKQADLQATRASLNAKLRSLLGFDALPDAPYIWPAEPLQLTELTLDAENEVAYGLAMKPELAALRRLTTADEASTAAAAEALLGDVHGLMGVAARSMFRELLDSLLGIKGAEAAVRRTQIRALYERRAMQLAADIRAAVETIDARSRQAVAAQRQVESRLRRIDEIGQRRETGQTSFVELSEARLQLIDERRAVTSAVIAWKRAIVELRELQGALVAECRGGRCPAEPVAPSSEVVPAIESLPPADVGPTVYPLPPIDLDQLDVDLLDLDPFDAEVLEL